jgi:hypothetical protein
MSSSSAPPIVYISYRWIALVKIGEKLARVLGLERE